MENATPTLPPEAAPSAEYVAQMTAATHGDPTPATATPISATPRPDHIPEKFWDPVKGETRWDDLARSYGELSTKLGAPKEEAAETPEAQPEGEVRVNPDGTIERPKEGAEKAEGEAEKPAFIAPMEALATAFDSGAHTEDHIKAVVDAGIPRQYVDTYLAGIQALAAQQIAEVHSAAGGQDQFAAAVQWAGKNLTDADLDSYNAMVDRPETRRAAVEWLMGKFQGANPSEGTLVQPTVGAAAGDVFNSDAERRTAFADPRYQADPHYRQLVAEKLLRSQKAGTINVATEYFARTR